MTTDTDLLREKPSDVGAGDPKAIAKYLTRLGAELRAGLIAGRGRASDEEASDARLKSSEEPHKKPRPVLSMNWNVMDTLAREEICYGAGIAKNIGRKQWEDLEPWLQFLLAESMFYRTRGRVALRGEQPVAWEANDTP